MNILYIYKRIKKEMIENSRKEINMNKKQIGEVIQILEETAERFNQLHKEAGLALPDRDAYGKKLFQKARLLIQLPLNLTLEVEGIEKELWKATLERINYFAKKAKEALQSGETCVLSALLVHPGHIGIENNDLQKLIDELKSLQKED